MTTDLPDELVAYLATRDAERTQQVGLILDGLSDREKRLVREAAVMGFVRGSGYGAAFGRDERVPQDSTIVYEVVDACRTMPDLYPLLGGDRGDREVSRG